MRTGSGRIGSRVGGDHATNRRLRPGLDPGPRAKGSDLDCSPGPRIGVRCVGCGAIERLLSNGTRHIENEGCMDCRVKPGNDQVGMAKLSSQSSYPGLTQVSMRIGTDHAIYRRLRPGLDPGPRTKGSDLDCSTGPRIGVRGVGCGAIERLLSNGNRHIENEGCMDCRVKPGNDEVAMAKLPSQSSYPGLTRVSMQMGSGRIGSRIGKDHATNRRLRPGLDPGPRAKGSDLDCSPGPRIGVRGIGCGAIERLLSNGTRHIENEGCMDCRVKPGNDEVAVAKLPSQSSYPGLTRVSMRIGTDHATNRRLRPGLDPGPRAKGSDLDCSPGPRIGVRGIGCCVIERLLSSDTGHSENRGCIDCRVKPGNDEVAVAKLPSQSSYPGSTRVSMRTERLCLLHDPGSGDFGAAVAA